MISRASLGKDHSEKVKSEGLKYPTHKIKSLISVKEPYLFPQPIAVHNARPACSCNAVLDQVTWKPIAMRGVRVLAQGEKNDV